MRRAAVPPLIVPPIAVPTPGISFNKFETIVRPINVALAVPAKDVTIDFNKFLDTLIPNIAVIPASMASCVGTRANASEKGKGIYPSPNL